MPTILVVDDDALDREQARRCLEPLEALHLVHAANGTEALERIEVAPPDLVLTDLRMPGMSGLELVERLRDEHPLVPTILMTSQGNERTAVEALHAGASSYVPKRDLQTDLLDTVRQVLDVLACRRSAATILRYLQGAETRFEIVNDPRLISPLVGFLEENLRRLDFGTPSIRTQIAMALMEALSNAIIHGNLEIGSELRSQGTEAYYREIDARRNSEPFSARKVSCTARESPARVEYVIRDEGPGFDTSRLPDPTLPENVGRAQGRGLFLIRNFMDAVTFNRSGNELRMIKRRAPAS